MTRQEAYDKMKAHLLSQMKRSTGEMGEASAYSCAYRGKNGLKCAIGALIPDELYDITMEGKVIEDLLDPSENPVFAQKLQEHLGEVADSPNFLQSFQTIHDVFSPERWEDGLKKCAKRYGLNP